MFDYAVGDKASLCRAFSAGEVAEFAERFGAARDRHGRMVPTGLVGGMFSTLLGTALPGRGTNWMKQTLRFRAPAWIDEPLTASVEIVRLRPDKRLINLRVLATTAAGAVVCDGEALVLALEMAVNPASGR